MRPQWEDSSRPPSGAAGSRRKVIQSLRPLPPLVLVDEPRALHLLRQPRDQRRGAARRVFAAGPLQLAAERRDAEGSEAGAAPLEAVRRAPERRGVPASLGLAHRGQLARRVSEVQPDQLRDQVRLALLLHLFEVGEHRRVNRVHRHRINHVQQHRVRRSGRLAPSAFVYDVDCHQNLLVPVATGRSVIICAFATSAAARALLSSSMRSMSSSCDAVKGLGRKTVAPAAKLSAISLRPRSEVRSMTGMRISRRSVFMWRMTSTTPSRGIITSKMAAPKSESDLRTQSASHPSATATDVYPSFFRPDVIRPL